MVLLSFLILIFGQTVLISCGTLQSINGTKVKGIVGETLKLEWIVKAVGNENALASAFMVCLGKDEIACIASGTPLKFSVDKGTAYTERIEAKYIDGKHVLKIKLVKKDDDLKLYITAIFRKSGTVILDVKHDNVTIHVGACPKLLQPLDSSLYFNENDKPTVNITASGIPRPNVTWQFNDASSEESYTDIGNDTYTYKYTLPELKWNLCGYKLNYTISGWDNRIITKTSTVIVKFQHKVTVTRTNYTVFVSWDENNYGNCAPLFTIEVLNTTGHVVGSKTAATSPTNLTFDAKVGKTISKIRFNTSYHGIRSIVEENIPPLPTTPTSNPTVSEPPSDSSSSNIALILGIAAGVIVIIIIIVVIVIYLKRKNKNNSLSAIGSSQGIENSYNHVPLDRRDGAEENNYTSVPSSKPPSRADDPDQMLYAELGAGGGRTGPKPAPEQSNYAVVKVDDMGYPARGPTSDKKSQPTYAAVNRDQSRRHSPPPPDDDNEGVIV